MIPTSTEVADSVRRSWAALHFPELKQVTCVADQGEIILRGNVPSYYPKQMAQAVAQRVPGVRRVTNNVQVGKNRSHQPVTSSTH